MKKITFLFLASLQCLFAQNELPFCGADEMRINTLKANTKIAEAIIKRDAQLEAFTQQYVDTRFQKNASSATYIIPVVFHVIHNYGTENISNAQILDAITVLNKRFRKQSSDTSVIVAAFKPLHADCDIEFRLAQKDPNGNCTSGINRIASSLTAIGDHSVKSLIQWPPDKYLNIYVVQNAAGLAGHAVWPADADTIPAWDGIVIAHSYVGSIGTSNATQSVVLAHECGHYFNLHHVWGGNNVPGFYFYPCADPNKNCNIDDLVADTPPTIGWQTCNINGSSCGNVVDNVQNMMEYSYCNKMFTYGQKARMHACLNDTMANRNNLWQPANLLATGVSTIPGPLCKADFTSDKNVVCQTGTNQITFTNASYNGSITAYDWQFAGGNPAISTASAPVVTYSTVGVYPVTLKVYSGTDSAVVTKSDFITVLPSTGSSLYPFVEGFETTLSLNGPSWYDNSYDTINHWLLTSTAAYNGVTSVKLDNFYNPSNTKDELYSPIIDLSGAGSSSLSLRFKYAYARKDSLSTDQLQLYVGKSCTSWLQRLNLIGSALETVVPQTTPFVPASTNEWKEKSINIPTTYNTSDFRFKFVFTSKGGNNLYIDDINIDLTSLGMTDELSANDINLFPNPVNESLTIGFNLQAARLLRISVVTVLGQTLYNSPVELFAAGNTSYVLDTKQFNNGFYFLKIADSKLEILKPFIVQRSE